MARFIRSAAACAVCFVIMSVAASGAWAMEHSHGENPAGDKNTEIEKNDSSIQAEVEKALRHAPGVPDFLIAVQTEGDTVKLYGATETEEQKKAAETAANGVSGVSTVENLIVVKDIMSLPDDGPSESVKAQWKARNELRKQLDIPDHLLSVTFEDGTATVTGVAPSEEDRAKAERIVSEIEGVDRVTNNIRVADAMTDPLPPVASDRPTDPGANSDRGDDATSDQ